MTAMVVVIGAPGAGKSTLCRGLAARDYAVFSLDAARGRVGRHSGDQGATPAALVDVIVGVVDALRAGRAVAIDTTATTARERAVWLGLARAHRVEVVAEVLRTPHGVCQARNWPRPEHRRVPVHVIADMWLRVAELEAATLRAEGFDAVRDGCVA